MNTLNLRIDEAKCLRCGACAEDCPAGPLAMNSENGLPTVAEGGAERCLRCQHCLAICPVGALSIFGRDPDAAEANEKLPAPGELLNLIRCRRSFRRYRRENLPSATMEKLLEMPAWVPTGVNDHRLRFSVIDDLAVMERFRRSAGEKVLAAIAAGGPAGERFARYRDRILAGDDVIFRGAPHLIVVSSPADAPCAAADPVIALSYFELYAQSLGVGTVWAGIVTWILQAIPALRAELGIPDDETVGYAMLFGPTDLKYPRGTLPEPVTLRRIR